MESASPFTAPKQARSSRSAPPARTWVAWSDGTTPSKRGTAPATVRGSRPTDSCSGDRRSLPWKRSSEPLVGLQHGLWIEPCRASRGDQRRRRGDREHRRNHEAKDARIVRLLVEEERSDPPPGDERDRGPDPHARRGAAHALKNGEPYDAWLPGAEGETNPQLVPALRHGVRDHAIEAQRREDQRNGAERRENRGAEDPRPHLGVDVVAEPRNGDIRRARHLLSRSEEHTSET